MKSYTYYSDGGYRFFYIDGQELKEITTDDYLGLPQSAIYYCSHYGLKVVYRTLPEKKLMLAVLNIPSKAKDDSGRKIPFSMLFIGVREDIDRMNKLAMVVGDNLDGFERFIGDLFRHDAEGRLYFDSGQLDAFMTHVNALVIPHSSSELCKVSPQNSLLVFEGSSLKTSIKEFEAQFPREVLDAAVILSKTEALAYQERMGFSFKRLTGEKEKGKVEEKEEEKPVSDVNPVDMDSMISELQRTIDDLRVRGKEKEEELEEKEGLITSLKEQIIALKKLLSERDKLIEGQQKKLYLMIGCVFVLGVIIGCFFK